MKQKLLGPELTKLPSETQKRVLKSFSDKNEIPRTIKNSFEIDKSTDAIVDGILGYSIKGKVKEPFKTWIEEINGKVLPVFSFDIPSGLDPDNGNVHGIAVKADSTLTLAYPKKGLFDKKAKKYVGELYLADIGIPPAVYEKVKKKYSKLVYNNPFLTCSLVKIA